jgi:hypothetical protein
MYVISELWGLGMLFDMEICCGRCGDGKSSVPLLVVSLGSLAVNSKPRDPGLPSISHLLQSGSSEQEVLQEMIAQSYDRFSLSLSDMQVMFQVINYL